MTTERTSASAAAQPKAPSLRVASMVSDTVGPLPSLAALCAAGAIGSSPVAGIGWGLLAMFFVAILPYVATWKIRHPAEGGRLSVSVRAGYMGLAALTAADRRIVSAELQAEWCEALNRSPRDGPPGLRRTGGLYEIDIVDNRCTGAQRQRC
jgi:hypothetical protein